MLQIKLGIIWLTQPRSHSRCHFKWYYMHPLILHVACSKRLPQWLAVFNKSLTVFILSKVFPVFIVMFTAPVGKLYWALFFLLMGGILIFLNWPLCRDLSLSLTGTILQGGYLLFLKFILWTDGYSTIHYSRVQYSTIQYCTVQYNTILYSTVRYITVE